MKNTGNDLYEEDLPVIIKESPIEIASTDTQ